MPDIISTVITEPQSIVSTVITEPRDIVSSVINVGPAGPSGGGGGSGINPSNAPAHNWANGVTSGGDLLYAQPAFSDISGQIAAAQMVSLPSGYIYIGNGSGVPVAVTVSGDIGITNVGVITIQPGAVTYSKMQNESAKTLLGNPSGSSASPSEVSMGNLFFQGTKAFSVSDPATVALSGGI